MNKPIFAVIIGLICLTVAGPLSANAEGVNIQGFISQGYLKTDQNNYLAETDDGSFQFNEMGINFTTFVSDKLKMGCQFFARDLGTVGNDDIVVNWAFAEYGFRNWMGVRVGLIKIPFGFYNDLRDFDSLRPSILLPSSVYNEWVRDSFNSMKGFELYGLVDIGGLGDIGYQLQAGEIQVPLDSGTGKYILEIISGGLDSLTKIKIDKAYVARLIWTTPLDGLRIGGSFVFSGSSIEGGRGEIPISLRSDPSNFTVFSIEYIYQNLKIAVENFWVKNDQTILTDLSGLGLGNTTQKSKNDTNDSFYISLGYRFADWFEAAYYYSDYIQNEDLKGDENKLRDQCFSFRFDINPNWLVKLETHLMNGEFGVSPDDDGHTYNEWMLYAVKVSYSF
jgi:hypothetical protein